MTVRPHHIHPRDWAAMSWHQQARAHRAWVNALEAERPPRRVEPVVVGPYSRVDAEAPTATMRVLIAILTREIEDARDAHLAPHGTRTARERHRRAQEPMCPACQLTRRPARPVTPDEVALMGALRAKGLSLREIADRTQRGHTTVKDHLRAARQENAA